MMDIKALIEAFNKNGFVKFGRFELKNGSYSSMYIDCRLLNTKPRLLNNVAQMIAMKVKENNFSKLDSTEEPHLYLLGVPYGAIPVATVWSTSRNIKKSILIDDLPPSGIAIVAKEKGSGSNRKKENVRRFALPAEYGDKPEAEVIIIEDVVTSGSSICETLAEVRKAGMVCTQAFCIVDRQQGAAEKLRDQFADKCDIIIVGRGITQAKDIGAEARKYKDTAWAALESP